MASLKKFKPRMARQGWADCLLKAVLLAFLIYVFVFQVSKVEGTSMEPTFLTGDKLVIAGGILPEADVPKLLDAGVARVFGPGASTDDIAAYIREAVSERQGAG